MTPHDKLRQRLIASHEAVLKIVNGWDENTAAQPSTNPHWRNQDVLAHLAAAEIGHCQVIRRLLADDSLAMTGFDLDTFNDEQVALRVQRSLAEILTEYRQNRSATLALLDTVIDDDWEKGGRHPGGFDTTVTGVFRVIIIHEKRHLKEFSPSA
ncbi:MAG: DinB family protein [Chloroflexi bacterium]|nr:DinB family protein [Chloroflexota bacterium]